MPADEVHHEGSAKAPRARTGPRHAAPRKPLLTRLQVPAGKAIALAAMPTAVLMGMGLTPTLAQARPGAPENPFQDGPCVTAPDKDAEADEKDAKDAKDAKGSGEPSAPASPRPESKGSAKPGPDPTPSAGEPAGEKDAPKPDPGLDPDPEPEPEPEPEPTKSKNPWDPLGLGDALKDAFTPDEPDKPAGSEKEPEKEPESPEPSASKDSKSPEDAAEDPAPDPVKDTVEKVEDGVGKAKDGAEKATEAENGDEAEAEDPAAPDENGKKPFPCVVEKKVDGESEQSPAPIPYRPWHLEASALKLTGADYQGVVNLTMPNGRTKQALKYVVQKTDIDDLHQIVEGPGGKKYHVEAAKGSRSTIRGGETTMYTERISGKLFGLIPITFDPEHPPPLNIPLIYFTDVKVQQAGQFGGNLTIPGLHQSITD
ncbi:hypothetical protein DMA15_25985 [Streptomyces sp. WAC 01529]|uniref:hypothetical protein n=1 Tax=Streptomyces sp. WAC 01529 TaxID=2203205 RepID=UPI000F6DEB58|nr:hypothetical protein [Streptomyces sp. WAC 01529]AZM55605.1 hypothetical protein DMA15_25985 [Streptomyces sp. WAC 01529]